mgnify:CR=1 FL=1
MGYGGEFDRLEQEFYYACKANQPDTQQAKRKQASAKQQQSAAKPDGVQAVYKAVNH